MGPFYIDTKKITNRWIIRLVRAPHRFSLLATRKDRRGCSPRGSSSSLRSARLDIPNKRRCVCMCVCMSRVRRIMRYLQLGGSSPRGVEAARRVRVRVVLLDVGSDGVDRDRGRRSTRNRGLMIRSADLALQQRGGRLAGGLRTSRRVKVLRPSAPVLLDGRVLRRRHHLMVQLGIRSVKTWKIRIVPTHIALLSVYEYYALRREFFLDGSINGNVFRIFLYLIVD